MDSLGIAAVERDVTARADAHVDTVPLPRLGRLLELQATDPSGFALSGVTFELQPLRGSQRSVTSPSSGRVLVHGLAEGEVTVSARRMGYRPLEATFSLGNGRTVVPLVLAPMSETLDTVVVTERATPLARHAEVEARRTNHEATATFAREDIVKRNPTDVWQVLATVPSIRVVDIDTMVVARSARTPVVANKDNDYCYMQVMVDGTILNTDGSHKAFDLRFLPPPGEIEYIEVFAGGASIPVKYGGSGAGKWCGLIAIWTR
jgi:hypothetical protein